MSLWALEGRVAATTGSTLDGAALLSSLDAQNQEILNLPAVPTTDGSAASRAFVIAQSGSSAAIKAPARAATVSALPSYSPSSPGVLTATANGAFPPQDSVTLALNDRVLVRSEAISAQYNGIYTLTQVGTVSTPWKLTRAADASTAALMQYGSLVAVIEGASQSHTLWMLDSKVSTLETSPVSYGLTPPSGSGGSGGGAGDIGAPLNYPAGTPDMTPIALTNTLVYVSFTPTSSTPVHMTLPDGKSTGQILYLENASALGSGGGDVTVTPTLLIDQDGNDMASLSHLLMPPGSAVVIVFSPVRHGWRNVTIGVDVISGP